MRFFEPRSSPPPHCGGLQLTQGSFRPPPSANRKPRPEYSSRHSTISRFDKREIEWNPNRHNIRSRCRSSLRRNKKLAPSREMRYICGGNGLFETSTLSHCGRADAADAVLHLCRRHHALHAPPHDRRLYRGPFAPLQNRTRHRRAYPHGAAVRHHSRRLALLRTGSRRRDLHVARHARRSGNIFGQRRPSRGVPPHPPLRAARPSRNFVVITATTLGSPAPPCSAPKGRTRRTRIHNP